jgi:hypothetical protein
VHPQLLPDHHLCVFLPIKTNNRLTQIITVLLQDAHSPAGADDFIPQLIFTVIRANPPNLHSNITYISRFCETEIMIMENLCFFTHMLFCISFIEVMQATSLKIDPQEYAKYVVHLFCKLDLSSIDCVR